MVLLQGYSKDFRNMAEKINFFVFIDLKHEIYTYIYTKHGLESSNHAIYLSFTGTQMK